MKNKQLDTIRYLLNAFLQSRLDITNSDLVILINDIAYAETSGEIDKLLKTVKSNRE